MQFSHFTSPPKTKSNLTKLGIKVRKNRSRNSESSDNSTDKDNSVKESLLNTDAISSQTKTTSGKLDSQVDGELATKATSYTEVRLTTDPEVTSQKWTHEQINDRLGNERELISSSSSIPYHHSQEANCDNLTVNSNSSVTSLVSCDYADSSDASDDLTWSRRRCDDEISKKNLMKSIKKDKYVDWRDLPHDCIFATLRSRKRVYLEINHVLTLNGSSVYIRLFIRFRWLKTRKLFPELSTGLVHHWQNTQNMKNKMMVYFKLTVLKIHQLIYHYPQRTSFLLILVVTPDAGHMRTRSPWVLVAQWIDPPPPPPVFGRSWVQFPSETRTSLFVARSCRETSC